MGTFKSSKILFASLANIPTIANDIEKSFIGEGFEVTKTDLLSGGYDISITKGNMFKAVLGMKSALKVLIKPQEGNIYIEAGVGIFGQQAIPTIITMVIAWPVLITQLWGMVQQAKLDDKVLQIAEESVQINSELVHDQTNAETQAFKFCPECGTKLGDGAKFCVECGGKV